MRGPIHIYLPYLQPARRCSLPTSPVHPQPTIIHQCAECTCSILPRCSVTAWPWHCQHGHHTTRFMTTRCGTVSLVSQSSTFHLVTAQWVACVSRYLTCVVSVWVGGWVGAHCRVARVTGATLESRAGCHHCNHNLGRFSTPQGTLLWCCSLHVPFETAVMDHSIDLT
jgi:hypothetical protein